jgi:hypothetical protein
MREPLQFEKADNKGAIIGYSAAAFGALVLTEWLIHLPGLSLVCITFHHHAIAPLQD